MSKNPYQKISVLIYNIISHFSKLDRTGSIVAYIQRLLYFISSWLPWLVKTVGIVLLESQGPSQLVGTRRRRFAALVNVTIVKIIKKIVLTIIKLFCIILL